jgi:hypothetical protein
LIAEIWVCDCARRANHNPHVSPSIVDNHMMLLCVWESESFDRNEHHILGYPKKFIMSALDKISLSSGDETFGQLGRYVMHHKGITPGAWWWNLLHEDLASTWAGVTHAI